MSKRSLVLLAGLLFVLAVPLLATASNGGGNGISGKATVEPKLVDDASLKAVSTTEGAVCARLHDQHGAVARAPE